MNALVNEKHNKSNDAQGKLLELLIKRIDEANINKQPIFFSIESPLVNFVNTLHTCDYEIKKNRLYLCGDFELSIMLDDVVIEYDNSYEEYFTLLHNDIELVITF